MIEHTLDSAIADGEKQLLRSENGGAVPKLRESVIMWAVRLPRIQLSRLDLFYILAEYLLHCIWRYLRSLLEIELCCSLHVFSRLERG